MIKKILCPIFILLISSCFLNPSSSGDTSKPIVSTENLRVDSLIPADTFLLLTNDSLLNADIPKVTVNGSTRSFSVETFDIDTTSTSDFIYNYKKKIDYHPPMPAVDSSFKTRSTPSPVTDQFAGVEAGAIHDFYVIPDYNESTTDDYVLKPFTLKSRSFIINDTLELYIWSDIAISDEQLNHIKDSFIGDNGVTQNGIYKDMFNIFGEHWGSTTDLTDNRYTYLSEDNRDIHILLTDIEGDQNSSPNGYIAGYFASSNTVSTVNYSQSNQALTLVLDSYDYLNPKKYYTNGTSDSIPWATTNYQTANLISTLIHEYQHLINFYQKGVKQNLIYDTFLNEMFSMVAEDILAETYLKVSNGVYGPDWGRIPEFNLNWDLNSSFFWDGSLNSYSMSYVLGAYLIRNYGIELFQKYLELNGVGIYTLLQALNSIDPLSTHTKKSLLQNLGSAILSSYKTTTVKPYIFNSNTDIDISGYKLKALDFLYGYGDYSFHYYTLEGANKLLQDAYRIQKESNIYIYLGKLDRNAEIIIEHYDESTHSKIVY